MAKLGNSIEQAKHTKERGLDPKMKRTIICKLPIYTSGSDQHIASVDTLKLIWKWAVQSASVKV